MSAEAELVQPRTSFLNLPDDILLPILEEFYEQRYESITPATPLRIAEILINKRIFLLARPLWHKRLSISEAQLDSKLSGLLEDKLRQASLCDLKVDLTSSHANLTRSLITLLPRLTELSLFITDNVTEDARNAMADRLATISSLRHLVLRSFGNMNKMMHFRSRYASQMPSRYAKVSVGEGDTILHTEKETRRLRNLMYRHSTRYNLQFGGNLWQTARSLDVQGETRFALSSDDLIESLTQALIPDTPNSEVLHYLPLHRLAMDLPSSREPRSVTKLFSPDSLRSFFTLLERTRIRQVVLRRLSTLPSLAEACTLSTVQLLRLSGTVDLSLPGVFPSLLALLECFPSLRQLHLASTFFAADSTPADSMSKHETMPLYFHYPQVCTLLTYLRQSQVLIFTYRGSKEGREMRWTRLTAEDEFDRDCWTL